MRKLLLVGAIVSSLAACSPGTSPGPIVGPPVVTPPNTAGDAAACALDLFEVALTSPNIGAIGTAALSDASCQGLAKDVLSGIIDAVLPKAKSMRARGLVR